mgnify:CR=1 FL=1
MRASRVDVGGGRAGKMVVEEESNLQKVQWELLVLMLDQLLL